jgi:hypothetical protein
LDSSWPSGSASIYSTPCSIPRNSDFEDFFNDSRRLAADRAYACARDRRAVSLGKFIAGVYDGERNFLTPVFGPVERGFHLLVGVDPAREQDWVAYTIAMVVFSVAGFLSLCALQRLQSFLPLNPRGFGAVAPDLAFNTSTSFITNTNWQNYSGETTMSHLIQMLGLTVHNFLSAATGLAMASRWCAPSRVRLRRPSGISGSM